MDLEKKLELLRKRIEPLERLIQALANSLPKPLAYDSGKQHFGFRYGKPDVRHFCLLKSIRALSAINAGIELARSGYVQEIAVLMRTVIECKTQIEFVISERDRDGNLMPDVAKYVADYFADYQRNEASDFKRPKVSQGRLHTSIAKMLKDGLRETKRESEFQNALPEKLLSNVYLAFSNYVHARYPEVMDMYGGAPPRFHVRGMKGTPKDDENFEVLETFVGTISLTLKLMATKLEMRQQLQSDGELLRWYQSQ